MEPSGTEPAVAGRGADPEKNQGVDPEKIKSLLDSSTEKTRHFFLTFLMANLYMLITAASTTHEQLLIPESRVTLPVVNFEIPLFGFYILAPPLIAAIHFNLLFSLAQHVKKLLAWSARVSRDEVRLLLSPFIFNFFVRFRPGQPHYYLILGLIYITTYFFPLALLLAIQLKFSPFHSFPMTLWHSFVFFADLSLLGLYWESVVQTPGHEKKGHEREGRRGFFGTLGFFGGFFWRFFGAGGKGPLAGGVSVLMALVSAASLFLVFSLWMDMNVLGKDFEFLYPRLQLKGKTLVAKEPGESVARYYMDRGKPDPSQWLDFTEGADLRGRDLRFADFSQSRLYKADLRGARLDGANLSAVGFHQADLTRARLTGAVLYRADFEKAVLKEADLRRAHLIRARMKGADLTAADMRGADLSDAVLEGAVVARALLHGAEAPAAVFSGADLTEAGMSGVDLTEARLDGAMLYNADLTGADLSGAFLDGAYIGETRMNGVEAAGARFAETAGDPNLTPPGDWSEVLTRTLPHLHAFKKGDFARRVEEAFSRSAGTGDNLAPLLKDRAPAGRFFEIRAKLACESPFIAAGMRRLCADPWMATVLAPDTPPDQDPAQILTDALDAYLKAGCQGLTQK
ncbi:membrane hypothetical protein [Candidatus Desulfarcum epimagneticum]|uniref:Pentapeptide repeat protein n=1 Tax=uncultured Desulfobacteraceae bacterium TaxID=218296 RepID=A0A484HH00_9BACT|nr:membrane hypothetical protein [uncultured Desulfobacteraceae bacterium]